MNEHEFSRLRGVVLALTELPLEDRDSALRRISQDDQDLARAAEKLLRYDFDSSGSLQAAPLEEPVSESPPAIWDSQDPVLPQEHREILDRLWSLVAAPAPDQSVSRPRSEARRAMPLLSAGELVAGRYRIEAFLDRGGMGEVHRAVDELLGVPVALKIIRPQIASDPKALRSFKREVLLARSVSHPNVCRIYDLGWDDVRGLAYLTMEFLPGETLRSRVRSAGPLPSAQSLRLTRQLADGLDAAHRAGVIHRDFKSANVMIVPDQGHERAVIMDFGLAVELEAKSSQGEPSPGEAAPMRGIAGTPAYMSPEQVAGAKLTPASDLYALGVVLFEMATGRLPFEHDTPLEMALAHLRDPAPSPREFVELDASWEQAILRLLAKEPKHRYATASEVVQALEGGTKAEEFVPNSLPAERDDFIGRERELVVLTRRLEGTEGAERVRLLAILGPGGIGKTRLAQKYGWTRLSRWPGGVWFCDLSEARTVGGIAHAVAAGLDVHLGKQDPLVQIGHAIAGRGRALVILDNFEQVAALAEATIGRWLQRTTAASFLVTSRERLHLPEESLYELGPLDPGTHGVGLLESRAHRFGFRLEETNRARAEEIVRRLDGLPLAIELAAARLRTLSLDQLGDRLENRFRVLTGGRRRRHETVAATLDWSWELLQPWEQSVVAQASAFEGGFTLEAAEAMIDLSAHAQAPWLVDVIQSLVDKSWLRAGVSLGVPRFGMFVTIRDYASSKLAESGRGTPASLSEVRARHGAYFARMGEDRSLDALARQGGAAAQAKLILELDNVVTACRRALEVADADTAVAAYLAAAAALEIRGPLPVAIRLGRELLGSISNPVLRARVLVSMALSEHYGGEMAAAREHLEEALAICQATGDRRGEGVALGKLGSLDRAEGRMNDAREHLEAALVLHRELGNRIREGVDVGVLGVVDLEQGRLDPAREHCWAALAIHRELGNRRMEANVLNAIGILEHMQGRLQDARACQESALAIHREMGNRRAEAAILGDLGVHYLEEGDPAQASTHYEEALAINREVGERHGEGIVLSNLGGLRHKQDRREEARSLLEAALSIHRELGNRRSEGVVLGSLGALCLDEGRFEQAQRHYEGAVEIHRDLGYRRGLGMELAMLGRVHAERSDYENARRCLEESVAVLSDVDQLELAKGLCVLGSFELRRNDLPAARAALERARSVAERLSLAAESEVSRAIDDLTRALGVRPAGEGAS